MPSLKIAQALLAPETQEALSLPTATLILGALSEAETVMEIVDRVCGPLFRGAVKAANSAVVSAGPKRTADPQTSASSYCLFRTI